MKYYMPTRFICDDDVLNKQADLIKSFGKKALIMTGKNSAKLSGALADLCKVLETLDISWVIYDGIKQNPTMVSCIEAGRLAFEEHCDFVVGLGGGSVLDASKVAAVSACNPELDEDGIYSMNWPEGRLPLLLIGLSAGTGSEVTAVAVLTNKAKRKKSIKADMLYGDLALGDPKYLLSLNREFSVSTGIDALAHMVEAYFSKAGDDICRGSAVVGVKKLIPYLKKLANNEELTLEDRRGMYEASILGGLAINTAGTLFPHNVGYLLTENYGVPHGVACATFMADLFRYEMEANREYTLEFFRIIDMEMESLIDLVESLLPNNNIEMSLEQIEELLPRWVNNKSVKNTMGNCDEQFVKRVLVEHFVK